MIAESLNHTIKLIETVQKIQPHIEEKIDRELCYLVEHMKYVEEMLKQQG